jgi:hypothetical protein
MASHYVIEHFNNLSTESRQIFLIELKNIINTFSNTLLFDGSKPKPKKKICFGLKIQGESPKSKHVCYMTFNINFSKNENLQGGDNIAIFVYIYRCPTKKRRVHSSLIYRRILIIYTPN